MASPVLRRYTQSAMRAHSRVSTTFRPTVCRPLQTLLNDTAQPLAIKRTITNATKPDYVSNLTALPKGPLKPGNWHPTLFHSSGEVKFTLIRLPPGDTSNNSQPQPPGEVPLHEHTAVWDYFIPIQGEGVIETRTKGGIEKDYEMRPGTFLAVGPGDAHRVRNVSKGSQGQEFVFVIAQAPRGEYDFIRVDDGVGGKRAVEDRVRRWDYEM